MDSALYGRQLVLIITCMILKRGVESSDAADTAHLLDTLLKGHRPGQLPRVNSSRPLEVRVGMGVMAIVDLDTKTQVLNLRAFFRVSWIDQTLHWDPNDFSNTSSVILPQNTLWIPDIALYNSLEDNIYPGGGQDKVRLHHDGQVYWEPAFNTEVPCQVDVLKYPMDIDTCTIKVGSWMYDDSLVHVEPMAGRTLLESGVTNGQFGIEVWEPSGVVVHVGSDGNSYSNLDFVIKLYRMPAYTTLSMMLPMFVIGLLNIISFLIPADNDGKVDLSLNIMLSTTMFLSIIHDQLPDRSDNIATIAVYVIALFVMSFLGVVGNTVVMLVHRREESEEPGSTSSTDNKFDPFSRSRLLQAPRRRSKTTSEPELDGDTALTSLNQSENDTAGSAHTVHVVSGSKAAKLNFLFLILSAVSLIACSLGVFVQIFF